MKARSRLSPARQLSRAGIIIAVVLLLIAGAVGAFFLSRYNQVVVTPNVSPTPQSELEPSPDPLKPFSVLLMGYGGGKHEGGKLTDTMMLAYVQPREQKVHLISLPRDLWVPLEVVEGEKSYWKLNAAYALGSDDKNYRYKPARFTGEAGGGQMAKEIVSTVTGLPVDYFVTINFASFVKSIDVLGGVDVRVERTFDDYEYPIEGEENNTCGKSEEEIAAITATVSGERAATFFPCRYEHLHFDRGVTHMDGETALKFVRSRHSAQDGNDFGRAARQRNLIVAVKNKVLAVNFIPKLIPFVSTLSTDLQTDISFSKMQEFLSLQSQLQAAEIESVALTNDNVFAFSRSQNGQFILVPKEGIDQWSGVHAFVQQSLTASSSATVSGQVSN